MEAHRVRNKEKSQLCLDQRVEASGQRGGKPQVQKVGAQVENLGKAGWPARVEEGKERRHREVSGWGCRGQALWVLRGQGGKLASSFKFERKSQKVFKQGSDL